MCSKDVTEGRNKLIMVKSTATIRVCNFKGFSQFHDLLKIDALTRVLFLVLGCFPISQLSDLKNIGSNSFHFH